MNKDTPAFPEIGNVAHNSDWQSESGMKLRDYFAAKALQGICSHRDTWGLLDAEIARRAYSIADDMMKAREK